MKYLDVALTGLLCCLAALCVYDLFGEKFFVGYVGTCFGMLSARVNWKHK